MSLIYLRKEIRSLADPVKAKILQRFFKTGKGQYGEGDKFLGIMVPRQRQLANKYANLTLADIDKLIKSKFHEERLVALLILTIKYQPFVHKRTSALKQKEIYDFYLSHTKYINNWDLVDLTAPKIIGAYLRDRDKSILTKMAKSPNLWERRIAILATFDFIYFGKPEWALKLAKMVLNDKHDLIHKASGWMLREAGKRCGEKYLLKFLDQNAGKMPRTMLRYAIERLNTKLKFKYMGLKICCIDIR